MSLTEAQLSAINRGEPVTIYYPVPDERRAPMPEAPVRLAILDAQRVAPRGAGLPRRIAGAGWLAVLALGWLYLLAHVAVACWRAIP